MSLKTKTFSNARGILKTLSRLKDSTSSSLNSSAKSSTDQRLSIQNCDLQQNPGNQSLGLQSTLLLERLVLKLMYSACGKTLEDAQTMLNTLHQRSRLISLKRICAPKVYIVVQVSTPKKTTTLTINAKELRRACGS